MLLSCLFPFFAIVLACLPKASDKERKPTPKGAGSPSFYSNPRIEKEFFDLWEQIVIETSAKLHLNGQATHSDQIAETATELKFIHQKL